MPYPELVLRPKPIAAEEKGLNYKQVLLTLGSQILGRSQMTGIRSSSVSRKQFEIFVDEDDDCIECKVKNVAKHNLSKVEVNNRTVGADWVDIQPGSDLVLKTATAVVYRYVLEVFNLEQHGASTPPRDSAPDASCNSSNINSSNSNGNKGNKPRVIERTGEDADEDEENMLQLLQCSFCMGIFVDPTEVNCKGRHLFCLECIKQILATRNDCPQCRSVISAACRESILGSKSSYTTRHKVQPANPEAYQSQAIMFMKEMIKRAIEKRICDYSDECEWRRRSGMEPLPPPTVRSKSSDSERPGDLAGAGTGTDKQNGAMNRGVVHQNGSGSGSSGTSRVAGGGGGGRERASKKAKTSHSAAANPSGMEDERGANVIDLVDDSDND